MSSGLFELDEETLEICFRSSKRLQNLRAHVEVFERIRDLISVSGLFDNAPPSVGACLLIAHVKPSASRAIANVLVHSW